MISTLYRVANHETQDGLWYDQTGHLHNLILRVPGMISAHLPMGFDPLVAGGWLSATDNLPDIDLWFSKQNRDDLALLGYGLYQYEVPSFKHVHNHVIFHKDLVLRTKRID